MVRRHNKHNRGKMTKHRPSRPAPTNGWLIADLEWLTGVPLRTIRYYVAKDVLQPLERRGTLTRYPRRALLRLLGTVRLLGERLTLAEVKKRLDTLGNPELEAWLREYPVPDAIQAALEADAAGYWPPAGVSGALNAVPPQPVAVTQAAPVQPAHSNELWHRVELLSGLTLQWPASAGPVITDAVRRIRGMYSG